MSNINDGGPAFPCEPAMKLPGSKDFERVSYPGMTLRDHFAAAALPALITYWASRDDGFTDDLKVTEGDGELIANDAYAIADYMLAARKLH